ncbi:SAV_915 family protein [Actinomadura napierensis]|uniref:SseB family protein n=1 Tax=Actinomadura napierensis TaxID=267854 RepID=A0ABN3ACP6_9ACTN
MADDGDGTAIWTQLVYVPSRRFQQGDTAAEFALSLFEDGRRVLPLYSSLELLVAGCGEDQPWVAVQLRAPEGIEKFAELTGADVVLWDVDFTGMEGDPS